MKNAVKTCAAIFIVGLLCAPVVSAGDIDKLSESIAKLEANIKALAEQQVEESQEAATLAADNDRVKEIKKELARLEREVSSKNIDQVRLIEILTETGELKSELQQITARHNEQHQLAASDEDAYAFAFGRPEPISAITQVVEEAGLEISGFFDALSTYSSSGDDHTNFGLNQAEIDLEKQISPKYSAMVAIGYNGDDGGFELAAAILDATLVAPEQGFVTRVGLSIGQFDAPFGVDYQVYASPDRKLVSTPMVVELTHGSWNDFGISASLETTHGNLVGYVVNGFESSAEVIDEAQSLALGETVYEEVDTSPANAFGTRLGIAPISALEIGGSIAVGTNASSKNEMILMGADVQANFFNFELKGEYISHSVNRSVGREDNKGWYLQTVYSFPQVFVAARYGSFKADGAEWNGQMSIGVGYALTDGVELRFETLINENSKHNHNIMQIVAGF